MMKSEASQKIRLRTESELSLQSKGLVEIRDILNEIQLPYFLAGGTLLGIVRENDFIKWDWDVEINVRTEEARPKLDQLKKKLVDGGFEIIKIKGDFENFKITTNKYSSKYEIIGYYLQGDLRMRRRYQIPANLFQKSQDIVLRNEIYKTFNLPEEYLLHTYGDWKTPRRTTDSHGYLNVDFHRDKKLNWKVKIQSTLKWINKKLYNVKERIFKFL